MSELKKFKRLDNLVHRIVQYSDTFNVKLFAQELIDVLDCNDETRKWYQKELERLYELGV